jgi:hypothetical protein
MWNVWVILPIPQRYKLILKKSLCHSQALQNLRKSKIRLLSSQEDECWEQISLCAFPMSGKKRGFLYAFPIWREIWFCVLYSQILSSVLCILFLRAYFCGFYKHQNSRAFNKVWTITLRITQSGTKITVYPTLLRGLQHIVSIQLQSPFSSKEVFRELDTVVCAYNPSTKEAKARPWAQGQSGLCEEQIKNSSLIPEARRGPCYWELWEPRLSAARPRPRPCSLKDINFSCHKQHPRQHTERQEGSSKQFLGRNLTLVSYKLHKSQGLQPACTSQSH